MHRMFRRLLIDFQKQAPGRNHPRDCWTLSWTSETTGIREYSRCSVHVGDSFLAVASSHARTVFPPLTSQPLWH